MSIFLLIIIYISFISLGLPDSLLGSAWPAMHKDFLVPVSYAGVISMIITGGTIISSFLSGKLIKHFGTGKVTFISVFITAISLFGFFMFPHFYSLCILAIPLGFGAGAVDSALNSFVALHYKAKHMNWLHCFWGIGATLGPIIMSVFLKNNNYWRGGYLTISILQFCLVIILFLSLSRWSKIENIELRNASYEKLKSTKNPYKVPGVKIALLSFFCYCATEASTGLWGSSFLVQVKKVPNDIAARWVSLFFLGITIGRFISGFITLKISNVKLIRLGQFICGVGTIILMLPLSNVFSMFGFILIGLGCAPIFPSMLHDTPVHFGKDISQSIMGIQMAFAYMGTTFMPPLLGIISSKLSFEIFPVFILFFIIVMTISTEKLKILPQYF